MKLWMFESKMGYGQDMEEGKGRENIVIIL